ncbi:MAG: hypothetical protein ACK5PS_17925, partial [Desulfopila sp.]
HTLFAGSRDSLFHSFHISPIGLNQAFEVMESMMLFAEEEWRKLIEIRQKTASSARQSGSAVMA